ncbi:MAG: hypothetical protein K2X98_04755 [Alphaproteobacteria bacterium]|nr:hypothetical protein [Alphaproteobacteria bacterium]
MNRVLFFFAFLVLATTNITSASYRQTTPQTPVSRQHIEQERQERLAQDAALYQESIHTLISQFSRMNESPGKGCWVERDCSKTYTDVFDDHMNELRRYYDYNSMRSIEATLNKIRKEIQNNIQTSKISFGTYLLKVLSDDAIHRLQGGERLDLPTEDKIKQILPGDLSKTELEVLLFEMAEHLEKSQKYDTVSSIKDFFSKIERFINLLPKGYERPKRELLDRLDILRKILQEREYIGKILHRLVKELPKDEQTHIIIPETTHFIMLTELRRIRKIINDSEKKYKIGKAFKDNRGEKVATETYKALYALVYSTKENECRRCQIRADYLKYITDRMEEYLSKLPENHPLRRDMKGLIKKVQEHTRYDDTFDFARALFEKMPEATKNEFKTTKFPSPDKLTDKEFEEAMTRKDAKKRLTTGHIMIMMLQKVLDQEGVKGHHTDYEQHITTFKSGMDKFLGRLEHIAQKINKKSVADIENLKEVVGELVKKAQKTSPKHAILEYLYDMIPEGDRTHFDPKKGFFLDKKTTTDGGDTQHNGERSGIANTHIPITAHLPHEKTTHDWDQETLSTKHKTLDVTIFPGEEQKKQEKEKNDKKKKNDKVKDIGKKFEEKAKGALGGFLEKAFGNSGLGKLFG